MPHSDIHQRKRAKNYTLLCILVGMMALFYALTMVKMGAAS